MKYLLCLVVVMFAGCSTAPRRTEPPLSERRYEFRIKHQMDARTAFLKTETALATAYDDLPLVTVLRQPETGTFILKPLLEYKMGDLGGPFYSVEHLRYILTVVAKDGENSVRIDLGPHDRLGTWPPEHDMPKIKALVNEIARTIAAGIGGTID